MKNFSKKVCYLLTALFLGHEGSEAMLGEKSIAIGNKSSNLPDANKIYSGTTAKMILNIPEIKICLEQMTGQRSVPFPGHNTTICDELRLGAVDKQELLARLKKLRDALAVNKEEERHGRGYEADPAFKIHKLNQALVHMGYRDENSNNLVYNIARAVFESCGGSLHNSLEKSINEELDTVREPMLAVLEKIEEKIRNMKEAPDAFVFPYF